MSNIILVGGYPFLFLAVILEGLPLIGTIVPGHVAIIAGGFLAHTGILNLWLVIILSLVAAVLGDFIGFVLGRKYGIHLIDRLKPYFFIKDDYVDKAQNLLLKHTGKAMILGRLSPVTRAIMPFLVGTGKTSQSKFWVFNVIGAVIWVGSSIVLGYVFSFGYHAAAGYFGRAVVIAIVFGGLIIWGYRFINIRFHIFRKYELFALIINIISLIILALMVRDALATTSFMANFDIYVNSFMNKNVGALSIFVAEAFSKIGSVALVAPLGMIIGGVFLYYRRWRSAVIMISSIVLSSFLVTILKDFFGRTRPENALQLLTDPSFPSGHATIAATFFLVCAYLFSQRIHHWVWRELFIVLCALFTIAIGVSRIVLNVHWVTDVVAGWALGIFCATACIILVRYVGELVKGRRV